MRFPSSKLFSITAKEKNLENAPHSTHVLLKEPILQNHVYCNYKRIVGSYLEMNKDFGQTKSKSENSVLYRIDLITVSYKGECYLPNYFTCPLMWCLFFFCFWNFVTIFHENLFMWSGCCSEVCVLFWPLLMFDENWM